jgi:hypothetical protein
MKNHLNKGTWGLAVLTVALLGLESSGWCMGPSKPKDSVAVDAEITNSVEVYAAPIDNTFSALKSTSHNKAVFSGTGKASSLQQKLDQDENQVFGEDLQGFQKLTLEKADPNDNALVMVVQGDIEKSDIQIKGSYRADAVITKGSWQDYLSGKEIEVALTDAGAKVATDAAQDELRQAIDGAMQRSFGSSVRTQTTVEISEPTSGGGCRFSKSGAVCTDPDMKIRMVTSLELNQ